ncbi:MAG: glutamate--tRNA ligase [Phycisphaeraceae bacterium]|nr:glutamate--tRNA ligase [Phycisphaeraceae bacterium]
MAHVVTRFAPSPTGWLHVGGARTALFCYAFAKRGGGSFLLRIEDTDQARSSEDFTRGILVDMAWLGIAWDEGPAFTDSKGVRFGGDPRSVAPFEQSRRLDLYNQYLDRLIAEGKAYAAFEKPEELEAKRKAAIARKEPYRYDRAALEIPADERARRVAAGEPHVVRFLCPDEEVLVVDEVLGEVRVGPGEVDDFVIRKADGFPTYHFSVVIDDELMGVTHVLRGQEHLYNTPKHVALQRALGFRTPKFAHMPLIFNMEGAKMSKRERDQAARKAAKDAGLSSSPTPALDDASFGVWLNDKTKQLPPEQLEPLAEALGLLLPEVTVNDFRRAGYLPEVITNFIALLGWSPPPEAGENIEKFDIGFLVKWFDLGRIGKSNSRFDRKKLLAFNTDAIAAMPDDEFARRWREWCEAHAPAIASQITGDAFTTLASAVRPRCKTFLDAAEQGRFALAESDRVVYDAKSVEKNLTKNEGEGLRVLRELRGAIAGIGRFDAASVSAALESFAESRALGMGKVAQPLRVALTGSTISPPIGETLAVLGKDRTLARIDACLAAHA